MNEGSNALFQPLMTKRMLLIIDGVLLALCVAAGPLARLLFALPTDCIVQRLGYLCPACGGTRCVLMLLQGNIFGAFRMNTYFFLTGFFALGVLLLLHISVFARVPIVTKICRGIFHPSVPIAWAIGLVIFGILRNFI